MKKALILLLIVACAPLFGQVQERFKKTTKDTTSQETVEDTDEPAPTNTIAQQNTGNVKYDFWDDVMIGGGISLSFGSYTSIYIAPSIGYRINEYWIVGTGYNYTYLKWNQAYDPLTGNYRKVDGYENTIHGPKFFANFFPFDGMYLGAQFEYLNHDLPYYTTNGTGYEFENEWTPVLFLELGVSQKVGEKGVFQAGLRYNVLHDYNSPYSGAFFPVIGFMF